jgi:hypothetical protein
MIRRTLQTSCLLFCLAALCGFAVAQAQQTITLRMLDGRTGKLIHTSDFLVRINQEKTVHANWVTLNEDGTGKLTVPGDATVLSVRATYDNTMSVFVNCDTDNSSLKRLDREPSPDRWYKVSDILALGVVAPSGCGGKKVSDKLQVVAKPGEFIFFVRKRNSLEQFEE